MRYFWILPRQAGRSERLSQLAYPMRLAVGDIQHTVGVQDSVRARKPAAERIPVGAVSPLSGSEHGRDDSRLEIDSPDRVILGVRDVKVVFSAVRESLGSA